MRRKKYFTDYPEHYFQIIEHFESSIEPFSIEGTWGELIAARHDINRFFQKIFAAAEEDDYARQLAKTAEKIRFSISPGRAASTASAKLTARLDPLYRAIIEVHGKAS